MTLYRYYVVALWRCGGNCYSAVTSFRGGTSPAELAELAVLAGFCVVGAGEGLLRVEDVGKDVLQAFSECIGVLVGEVIYSLSVEHERRVVV